jgi:DNA invertase Pin-like site-specific DNA recombinase
MLDFAGIMDRAQRKGWGLVALDADVDTTTPTGRAMAHVTMTFAHLEREKIGERIREALAVKRSQGVRLGRSPTLPAQVARRIARERKAGKSFARIAEGLNADGVPTAQGARAGTDRLYERWRAAERALSGASLPTCRSQPRTSRAAR